MPNYDPYLRPGLPSETDVELYESAAEGQGPTTPVAVSAAAVGVASESRTVTHFVAVSAAAVGVAFESRTVTHFVAVSAQSQGQASATAIPPEATEHQIQVAAQASGVATVETLRRRGAPPPEDIFVTGGGSALPRKGPRRTHHVRLKAQASGVANRSRSISAFRVAGAEAALMASSVRVREADTRLQRFIASGHGVPAVALVRLPVLRRQGVHCAASAQAGVDTERTADDRVVYAWGPVFCMPEVTVKVDRAGRRRQEEELLLVGSL